MPKSLRHSYNHIKGRMVQSGLVDGAVYLNI